MRVTSWNCVCLADLERHAVAFPEQVERLADARRLMEEVLDAVGRGDEAKPTIGQTLDSASSRNHVVHPLREGPGRPSTCRVMPATVAHPSHILAEKTDAHTYDRGGGRAHLADRSLARVSPARIGDRAVSTRSPIWEAWQALIKGGARFSASIRL